MTLYRSPWSWSPPLAYGGHNYLLHDGWARCTRCLAHCPTWTLSEGFWPAFCGRWCPKLIPALPAGTHQLNLFAQAATA